MDLADFQAIMIRTSSLLTTDRITYTLNENCARFRGMASTLVFTLKNGQVLTDITLKKGPDDFPAIGEDVLIFSRIMQYVNRGA